jgi:hypothetical protein
MARPRLTEYLLKLATDAAELEKYTLGPKNMRDKLKAMRDREREATLKRLRDGLLKSAGVNPELRKLVVTGKPHDIAEAVMQELAKNSSTKNPFYGTGLAVVIPINGPHITQIMLVTVK